jgi:hypothetical protein
MGNKDALSVFFDRFFEGLIADAQSKAQKIPVSSFRHEEDEISGKAYAADYLKYLVYGRAPGKYPPPDTMIAWVRDNPDILARLQQVFKYLTEQGLAYIVGRKLAKEGSDIYSGKKEGVDFLGVMEKNMPDLLQQLARNEAMNVATSIRQSIK